MSSGFVSEAEIEEKKRLRQEEWEKVRQPHQPEEAPEEVIDHRSLFDRLEEQKQKKQLEYEEAHKLKNMIKGLDDDEVEFLDFVDQKKMEAEQLVEAEERKELQEFRKNVEKLKESSLDERIQAEIRTKPVSSSKNGVHITSQQRLLQGVVVKRKSNGNGDVGTASKRQRDETENENRKNESPTIASSVRILPGLGNYSPSSDSDSSSSEEDEPEHTRTKYDLLGRRLVYEEQHKK